MAMTYLVKKLVWLAQLAAALSCGLLIFWGVQIAGNNSGVGQGIYIFLCDVFGVPKTIKEANFLFVVAGIALGVLAIIPGILVAKEMYAFLIGRGTRFSLWSVFAATTVACLFLATGFMFRNSEERLFGLPKSWVFMAVYSALVWCLIYSFRVKKGRKTDSEK